MTTIVFQFNSDAKAEADALDVWARYLREQAARKQAAQSSGDGQGQEAGK